MKYKIVKGNIVKSDFESEYEPKEFVALVHKEEKELQAAIAQKGIYLAKATNVSQHHPHVLKIDEEKRNAIWLFHENFVAARQTEEIIKAHKKNIKGLKTEMEEITKQTGLKFE